MSGRLIVVAGSQYGSEGKGAVADHLSRHVHTLKSGLVAVRVAGPNAGHTVYGSCPMSCTTEDVPTKDTDHHFANRWVGHPWKLRAIPVAAVSNPDASLVIADGSEVDLAVLHDEVDQLDSAGYNVSKRLFVSSQATVLEQKHIDAEVADGIQSRLGSTAKGIGAARSDRIWRYAKLYKGEFGSLLDASAFLYDAIDRGRTVLIEGTQGYGLGLHAGAYPYCTSSDARAIDFLAMAGLSPWYPGIRDFQVWLATRVRPIRVAGNSGPLERETSWQELGLPEERTTVTNKVRRVGEWDPALVRRAIRANGGEHPGSPVRLAFTMVDTLIPQLTAHDSWPDVLDTEASEKLADFITEKENELGAHIGFIGTGPTTGFFRR